MNDIRRRVRARRQGNLIVVSVSLKRCQTGYFNSSILLDNMLYNIGLDIAATDLVLVNPSNTVYRGRGIEGLLEDYSEMDRFGHTIGYRQPGAMIFPVYTSYSKGKTPTKCLPFKLVMLPFGFLGEESGTPYPDRESVCGKSQSSALRRELNDSRETSANQFDAVQFSAAEFTREETVMNPFLFNVSVTQHGTGFVRSELNCLVNDFVKNTVIVIIMVMLITMIIILVIIMAVLEIVFSKNWEKQLLLMILVNYY